MDNKDFILLLGQIDGRLDALQQSFQEVKELQRAEIAKALAEQEEKERLEAEEAPKGDN